MFTFGCAPVLDLEDARLFAQQFQLEEDRPTLRRIARASILCHHDLVQCLDASRFIVRSQNDPDVLYEVVSTEDGYQCSCPDPIPVSISSLVGGSCTATKQPWCLN